MREREREREPLSKHNDIEYQFKESYIKKIEEIPNNSFNRDQKNLAIKIIEKCDIDDLDNIYKLITKRLSTGFVFDIAPSCNDQSISYLKYDNKLSFNLDLHKDNEYDENHLTNNNMLILGENYDALKNLLLTHRNKIDVIYIDPPYNTDAAISEKNNLSEDEILEKNSNKFVYRDKFSRTGWLNMMQDRLYLAKDLLKDDGVIFVSIDDSEQAYLKVLMDQIFGEDNFIANLIQDKRNAQNDNKTIEKNHEYILMFSKKIEDFKINRKYIINENKGKTFSLTIGATGGGLLVNRKKLGWTLYYNPTTNSKIPIMDYNPEDVDETSTISSLYKDDINLINNGYIAIHPPFKKNVLQRWTWNIEKAKQNIDKLIPKKNKNNEWTLNYIDERNEKPIAHKSVLYDFGSSQGSNMLNKLNLKFSNPKSVELLKFLFDKNPNKDAIILDFFAGSGTTGQAVMELNEEDGGNRKFILCTNNEEIKKDGKPTGKHIGIDICYERLYRVINGKGTKNETINWKYSDDKPSLKDNSLLVFDINYANVDINMKNFNSIYEQITKSEKLINNTFDCNEKTLIKKLYSLHPLKQKEE